MSVFNVYKPIGISPLDTICAFRSAYREYKEEKITYAGRLDPMADGVLLLLSGQDRFKKEAYLDLEKRYTATILFGIKTDSYDLLGLPKIINNHPHIDHVSCQDWLKGKHKLTVPPFSSIPLKGKPLFTWARSGKLKACDIPKKSMTVIDGICQKPTTLSSKRIYEHAQKNISHVRGDFRQHAILSAWEKVLTQQGEKAKFVCMKCTLRVTSGTYIRSLAHELGKHCKTGGMLLNLTRDAVGAYTRDTSKYLPYEKNSFS